MTSNKMFSVCPSYSLSRLRVLICVWGKGVRDYRYPINICNQNVKTKLVLTDAAAAGVTHMQC